MPVLFLDTSALAKLYIEEPGTDHMLSLAQNPENLLMISTLAEVELRSAVRKRERMRELESSQAQEALRRFTLHLETRYVRQPVNQQVIDRATELLDEHPLRAYDALQLASCLIYGGGASARPCFVCSDTALLLAARAEGILDLLPQTLA